MIEITSPNFGTLQITGENEHTAANQLKEELSGASKAQEILVISEYQKRYNVVIHPTNSHVAYKDRIVHSLL